MPNKKHKDKFQKNNKEDSMNFNFKNKDNFNNKIKFIIKLNFQETQVHHQLVKHLHKLHIQKDSIQIYQRNFSRKIERDRLIDIKMTKKYKCLLIKFKK